MKYHTEKKTQLTSNEKKISVDKKILVNKHQDDTSGLDYKYPPSNSPTQLSITHFFPTRTAGDISREQQDRKKRFKHNTTLNTSATNLVSFPPC
jgi:hypothetical protein